MDKMRGRSAAAIVAAVMVLAGGCKDRERIRDIVKPGGMISAVVYNSAGFRRYAGEWDFKTQPVFAGDTVEIKVAPYPGASKYFDHMYFLVDGERVGELVGARQLESGNAREFSPSDRVFLRLKITESYKPGHRYYMGAELFNREKPLPKPGERDRRGLVLGQDLVPVAFFVQDSAQDPLVSQRQEIVELNAKVAELEQKLAAASSSEDVEKLRQERLARMIELDRLRGIAPPDVIVTIKGQAIDLDDELSVPAGTRVRFESGPDNPADRYIVDLLKRDSEGGLTRVSGGEVADPNLNLTISPVVVGQSYLLRVQAFRGRVARVVELKMKGE